jgi:predicted nucleic acid-binding protein
MRRAVLNTNVLVAGLRSSLGASAEILRRMADEQFRAVVTVPLLFEYEAAIANRVTWMSSSDRDAFLDAFCSLSDRQMVYFLWRPFLRDPGDDMVLEAAVEAAVDCVVTHNLRDFEGVESRFGVRVVRPQVFLKELRS